MADSTVEMEAAAKEAAARIAAAKQDAKALQKEFAEALSVLQSFEQTRQQLEQARADLDRQISELQKAHDAAIAPLRAQLSAVSPIALDNLRAPPTKRAAYSDRMAAIMSKFSLLAYKRFEEAEGRDLLKALLEQAGFNLLATYDHGNTQAFLAQSEDFCVLSFRGTTSKGDWKINQQVFPKKHQIPGYPRDVNVHGGFLGAFTPIEVPVRLHLHELTGDRPIYITGHSLGGALALVASAMLGGSGASAGAPLGDRIAAVYTFGAPRVGGRSFENCVKAPHYRVVNSSDIVPWVPPTWLFGYRHSGDVRILRGYGSRPVSEQWPANLAFTALWMLLLYVTGLAYVLKWRSRQIDDHEIKRYVAKLVRIAQVRSTWS